MLRRKVQHVLERSGLLPGSHDHKAMIEILETYPRDELFQITEEELLEIAVGILHLGERRRVRLFVRRDVFGRFLSCLVFIPRERFNTENRRKIQEILQEAFGARAPTTRPASPSRCWRGSTTSSTPSRARCPTTTWRRSRHASPRPRAPGRTTSATPSSTRPATSGPARCTSATATRSPAPTATTSPPRQAVHDIDRIERLASPDDLGLSLYAPLDSTVDQLAFKVVRAGRPILLSDVLPLLENMGVRVSDERPYEVRPLGRDPVWIYDFGLQHDLGAELRVEELRETFQHAFEQVWRGEAENDGFNRLVLAARLTAREITILRAIAKYLRQAGSTVQPGVHGGRARRAPGRRPRPRRALRAPARPGAPADADEQARALERRLAGIVDGVASLDEDRILRGFLKTVRAVLRTNYFQADEDGRAKPYLSLKLDPKRIPDLPEPRPMFEVFVYSTRVEAVHLRGGKVARGGIRWSDRKEDFRTEVLGLMKAQSVKNAVIVPVGAKGGFVVKRPPAGDDRAALLAEVVECYRIFMRGLLDITDTIAGRRDRAAARRRAARRGRPVPRRRGRQGHGDVLGHRERDLGRVRLLARRRVRVGRLGGLRPQGDGDHRPRRLGVGAAALPRARGRRRDDRLHRGRDRRHVRRRVRERDAALAAHQAGRRLRPPARLPRPRPRSRAELRRASASSSCRARPGPTTARR